VPDQGNLPVTSLDLPVPLGARICMGKSFRAHFSNVYEPLEHFQFGCDCDRFGMCDLPAASAGGLAIEQRLRRRMNVRAGRSADR
jgi:hypothetical protein